MGRRSRDGLLSVADAAENFLRHHCRDSSRLRGSVTNPRPPSRGEVGGHSVDQPGKCFVPAVVLREELDGPAVLLPLAEGVRPDDLVLPAGGLGLGLSIDQLGAVVVAGMDDKGGAGQGAVGLRPPERPVGGLVVLGCQEGAVNTR